jgi:hypothetical protein
MPSVGGIFEIRLFDIDNFKVAKTLTQPNGVCQILDCHNKYTTLICLGVS